MKRAARASSFFTNCYNTLRCSGGLFAARTMRPLHRKYSDERAIGLRLCLCDHHAEFVYTRDEATRRFFFAAFAFFARRQRGVGLRNLCTPAYWAPRPSSSSEKSRLGRTFALSLALMMMMLLILIENHVWSRLCMEPSVALATFLSRWR